VLPLLTKDMGLPASEMLRRDLLQAHHSDTCQTRPLPVTLLHKQILCAKR
jgi:hypothetical protein